MNANYPKLQNASHWLNHHAYLNHDKKAKCFTPCARSKPIIDAMQTNEVLLTTLNKAIFEEHCICHPEITVDILLNYCHDDRAKKAYGSHLLHKL